MRGFDEIDELPLEKRISVFMRNDRESPKGQAPLPSNQTSYIYRDVYSFGEEVGCFPHILCSIVYRLAKDRAHITEIRMRESTWSYVTFWNFLMGVLRQKKLIAHWKHCYGKQWIKIIKNLEDPNAYNFSYAIWYEKIDKNNRQKYMPRFYSKNVSFLNVKKNDIGIWMDVMYTYLGEREQDRRNFNALILWHLRTRLPHIDPRGVGLKIYRKNPDHDGLRDADLVKAYMADEPLMEIIVARCEQEVEIRINESLISVDEVIAEIREALAEIDEALGEEPLCWQLDVRL